MDRKETVVRIVSQVMGVPEDQVDEGSSPDSIEAWDSLKHMRLIMTLEEVFGVEFSDERIVKMLNVGLIVVGVNELLQ